MFQGSWHCTSLTQGIAVELENKGTKTPQNGGHYTHNDKASLDRRSESSATPLSEYYISQIQVPMFPLL
jgi:hypothetical protein